MGWTKRWRKRLRAVVRKDAVERELDEELAFHLEMETQKNLRAGMSPDEARRQAAIAFGGVDKHKEGVRDARALGWVTGMSLDLKLGVRMLAKYPAVTLVGSLAIAFGIAVGAATFEAVRQVASPTLPLDEGDRVVGIVAWNAATNEPERRILHDFAAWRREIRTVRDLGAFRMLQRNLVTGDGRAEPAHVAEISASAFRMARVPPLLGRTLVEADEAPGAEPVVVIGHDVWRTRFGSDPGVVGRTVRFGGTAHTVVGVMPEGFGFPLAHGLWVPLRLDPLEFGRREGPGIYVFGRLAPGAGRGEAQAELATLARRAAADFPDTHRHLRPEVLPYPESLFPLRVGKALRVGVYSVNLVAVVFLALLCANVAILVFARTAARESELVVRSALGASRRRIVLQLFGEALVLGGVAAVAGLAVAAVGLRWGLGVFTSVVEVRPFWWDARLSPATVLYVGGLTVLGAAIVGAVPALKATGPRVETQLRRAAAGSSGLRFGGLWTAVIVVQVALTMMALPILIDTSLDTDRISAPALGFAAEDFLSLRLEMDGEPPAAGEASRAEFEGRFRASYQALERRLEAEPGVAGVTYASELPGAYHGRRWIEVEGAPAVPDAEYGPRAQAALVDPDFFGVLGVPVVAGRGFTPADVESERRVVVVNPDFVQAVLGGRNPVGRRVRYLNPALPEALPAADVEPGPWYEIVGVVGGLPMTIDPDLPHGAGLYHPAAPGAVYPANVAVRVRGEPASFAPRLRAVALATDPALRLYRVLPMTEIRRELRVTYEFWLRVGLMAGGLLLLLSFAGIYSIMSFTVSRRTREIGIRVALGAGSRRIVAAIFSRALAQLGMGVAAGVGVLLALGGGIPSARGAALLGAGVALMLGTGMLACLVPTRRALRIQPTEALRADA